MLIDELYTQHPVPLLALHDFDKSGFSIIGTLQRDTRRYEFSNRVRIIDLGLRLADVEKRELESEAVHYGNSDPGPNLRANGASNAEIAFLCEDEGNDWSGFRGRRVELNALASDQLVAWIEEKLKANGIKKVVPDARTLKLAYRRAAAIQFINNGIEQLRESASRVSERITVRSDLKKAVQAHLREHPEESWDQAVDAIVEALPEEDAT
jgi:hypothetical protein